MLRYVSLATLAIVASSAACVEEMGVPVTLNFAAQVNGEPLACQSYSNIGTQNNTIDILDFRVYVSNVRLLADDGEAYAVNLDQETEWQTSDVALLDFEDNSGTCVNGDSKMNSQVVGTVPDLTYTGLRFDIGVPQDLNDNDPLQAASPLDTSRSRLHWTWQTGYKFVRWDADVEGAPHDWFVHLGSTGCTLNDASDMGQGATCTTPNRPTIQLDTFNPSSDTAVFDYGLLLADSDLSVNVEQPGCMSGIDDTDCPAIYSRFGLDASGTPNLAQSFVVTN